MIARLACVVAVAAVIATPAAAAPLTADRLPPDLLAACDALAAPLGGVAEPIAEAARALIDIGALKRADFDGVRLGFCGLRAAGGPVAAAACDSGVILLDEKYKRAGEALVLRATLAHEMKHQLQHRERKARFGADYCESDRYIADKPALEVEADAFGDAVGELFVRGRAVEVVNACAAPVTFYLEADDPVAISGAAPAFQRIAPKSSAIAPERALSGRVRFYAETEPTAGRRFVWRDAQSAETRFVEGRLIRLRAARLSAAERKTGAFTLRLTCRPNAHVFIESKKS